MTKEANMAKTSGGLRNSAIKRYGDQGYALFNDGKQITRALFGGNFAGKEYKNGKEHAELQKKFYEDFNISPGSKIQIKKAKSYY